MLHHLPSLRFILTRPPPLRLLLMPPHAVTRQVPSLLPLCAFPFLAVSDLYSIYRELKAVQLKSLNRERAEVVAQQWLATGRVPGAAEVRAMSCVDAVSACC